MIIVFISISLLMIIGGYILYNIGFELEDLLVPILEIVGVVIFMGSAIGLIVLIDNVKQLNIMDKKIQMYQEENNRIENNIDVLVKNYMEHEKSTLKEFKVESSITLVNLYPELKSNELVQQQLNIYVENNNKIKELKEHKLDYQISKWWLYFGKV